MADLETVDKAEIRGDDTTTTITMETSARAADHHQEGPQHGGRRMELKLRLRRRRRRDPNRTRTNDNRHLRIILVVEAKEKVRATIPEARGAIEARGSEETRPSLLSFLLVCQSQRLIPPALCALLLPSQVAPDILVVDLAA